MIKISVDFAYALDFISILEVKIQKNPNKNNLNVISHLQKVMEEIMSQVGMEKYYLIKSSEEYKELYQVNEKLYDLVDLAKKDQIKASVVDQAVWQRFLAKQKLQEKFFPSTKIAESKFGYV